jgi:hypothetical protein
MSRHLGSDQVRWGPIRGRVKAKVPCATGVPSSFITWQIGFDRRRRKRCVPEHLLLCDVTLGKWTRFRERRLPAAAGGGNTCDHSIALVTA